MSEIEIAELALDVDVVIVDVEGGREKAPLCLRSEVPPNEPCM
jgi:hypothetical protein